MLLKPFPLDTNYEISDCGDVFSHYLGRNLAKRKTHTKGNEYEKFHCAKVKKDFLVHRALALSFGLLTIDEFNNPNILINHKNSIKMDNRLDNLEKVSFSGNLLHYHKQKYTIKYLVKNCSIQDLEEALKIKKELQ